MWFLEKKDACIKIKKKRRIRFVFPSHAHFEKAGYPLCSFNKEEEEEAREREREPAERGGSLSGYRSFRRRRRAAKAKQRRLRGEEKEEKEEEEEEEGFKLFPEGI